MWVFLDPTSHRFDKTASDGVRLGSDALRGGKEDVAGLEDGQRARDRCCGLSHRRLLSRPDTAYRRPEP